MSVIKEDMIPTLNQARMYGVNDVTMYLLRKHKLFGKSMEYGKHIMKGSPFLVLMNYNCLGTRQLSTEEELIFADDGRCMGSLSKEARTHVEWSNGKMIGVFNGPSTAHFPRYMAAYNENDHMVSCIMLTGFTDKNTHWLQVDVTWETDTKGVDHPATAAIRQGDNMIDDWRDKYYPANRFARCVNDESLLLLTQNFSTLKLTEKLAKENNLPKYFTDICKAHKLYDKTVIEVATALGPILGRNELTWMVNLLFSRIMHGYVDGVERSNVDKKQTELAGNAGIGFVQVVNDQKGSRMVMTTREDKFDSEYELVVVTDLSDPNTMCIHTNTLYPAYLSGEIH